MSDTANAAAPAKAPPKLAEERKVIALREDLWSCEGFRFGRHEVTPDPRAIREDLLQPEYWTNIAAKLAPGGRIEAHWQDGSAYGEYYVRRRQGSYVEVLELNYWKFPSTIDLPKNASLYDVHWAGTTPLWRVVRKSDKKVLRDKFVDEFSAWAWLRQQPWARAG